MSDIDMIRLKTGIKVVIERETVTTSGTDKYFKLRNDTISADPAIIVQDNGTVQTDGVDYTTDLVNGIVTFTVPPPLNDQVDFTYFWSVYSDAELQMFLDQAAGNINIATAYVLFALAADAARLAKRQTLIGGGGIGQVTIDSSVAAKELRASAQSYLDGEANLGNVLPADGLTTPPWTEAEFEKQLQQSIIRNS